ncbi:D-2-hydroxyglutarate dehydrogenase YdiJ [Acanthopleuribacter pedis]|uniref:D-2-hydroxyglutarate dehydrogenase n=1 Tax=Acanthopleuribacter pedis TaxID=442870 RepID=A0A8J7QK30_9BACT|nr:FAD-binding and (Fe-S)-binding domain-containing protein [Acanthopleuribacter pedis]MBO1322391.1 FAD-binding oxidoreductase [Acanthopleuribacter pedis]
MIPQLQIDNKTDPLYRQFLDELAAHADFNGEIRFDLSTRLVAAVDNSIYQVLPQAVIFPRSATDIATAFSVAAHDDYQAITFSPRGGGTGTNGQSLTSGLIIDGSKYMNNILEVNTEARWAWVQPGVVLDQLNEHLKETGLFFAPNLSPSNRATIGGMINTDACGKGSRVYGKTSSHILEMEIVLLDGTIWQTGPITPEALADIKKREDQVGAIHRVVDEIVTTKKALIEAQFPKMRRFMTGYNLAKVTNEKGEFNLGEIIAGSEGSLAMVTRARVHLEPIPKHKGLALVRYPSFDAALGDAMALLGTEPSAIETIDDKILELARHDAIYGRVKTAIGDDPRVKNINLVEFAASDEAEVEARLAQLKAAEHEQNRLGVFLTREPKQMAALWDLRKKGVGLLGNMPGNRKPVAFVEDTAVPPHHLAAYIQEFRELLNSHGLQYGMFGHVDVGCLHVRPALDLQDKLDEPKIREISDGVVALVRKYGGVMWAEHGKGFRSEYTPLFFGDELYRDLQQIKAAFDPDNRMNPGKVVTPAGLDVETVKVEAPLRGQFDRQVPRTVQQPFQNAMYCNGNGACFNVHHHHVMCPSSKVTRDRIHSPKGRATLIREWLRALSQADASGKVTYSQTLGDHRDKNEDLSRFKASGSWWTRRANSKALERGTQDFSHEVYEAMGGCLSCKACATQCPINVDIPHFKAQFLELYHTRYQRPMRDYLVGFMERSLPMQARFAGLANVMSHNGVAEQVAASSFGMVDAPKLSVPTLSRWMGRQGLSLATPERLKQLSAEEKARAVVLMQDAFTAFYDCPVFRATHNLLKHLGFHVFIAPFLENGKALHIKGFLKEFRETAKRNSDAHAALAVSGVPLVGIEPSVVLTYRDEYPHILGVDALPFEVHLLQEWLADHPAFPVDRKVDGQAPFSLLGHCMEKTGALDSQQQWARVFAALGLELTILPAGCCGMAGVYGHEKKNLDHSKGIFDMSWGLYFREGATDKDRILATGYSCRTQTQRFAGTKPDHPCQALCRTLGVETD